MVALRALVLVALWSAVAHAQPLQMATSDALRQGNAAALAGDWQLVAQLIAPLFDRDLDPPDRSEAHRLAGITQFFEHNQLVSERHFIEYLTYNPDGRLDPALYPPEVVEFFNDVASRHAADIKIARAARTPPERSWFLTLLPPLGQWQNGDHGKAYAFSALLGASLAVNLITYSYIRRWCDHTDGPAGGALTCDDGSDHTKAARNLLPFNQYSGVAAIGIYALGVLDGIWVYRRKSHELALRPYVTASHNGASLGLSGSF